MKTIGYVRVSTAAQAAEGVSMEAQKRKIEAWAELRESEQVLIFEDAQSGKRADNREGLQAALACIEPGDALVCYSLSRLGRSTRETLEIAERIEQQEADLVSLSEQIDTRSAAGKMVFRMLAVLSEFERDQLSERTTAALQHIRASGKKTGGTIPYGWRVADDGRTLLEEPEEQETIERMVLLRGQGFSYRAIGDQLEAAGIRTRSGKSHWAEKVVRGIVAKANPEAAKPTRRRPQQIRRAAA